MEVRIPLMDLDDLRRATTARIGSHDKLGFYVVRSGEGGTALILHADGVWRDQTTQRIGEQLIYSGFFPSEEEARKVALAAGAQIEEPPCERLW